MLFVVCCCSFEHLCYVLFVLRCVLLFVCCLTIVHSLVVVWRSLLVVVWLLVLRDGVGVGVCGSGLLLFFLY